MVCVKIIICFAMETLMLHFQPGERDVFPSDRGFQMAVQPGGHTLARSCQTNPRRGC